MLTNNIKAFDSIKLEVDNIYSKFINENYTKNNIEPTKSDIERIKYFIDEDIDTLIKKEIIKNYLKNENKKEHIANTRSFLLEIAKTIKPSKRGEYEITTLNDMYLQRALLKGEILGEGFYWFDTGTFSSQLDAANTIKSIQANRDKVISCLETIAFNNGWIDAQTLRKRAELLYKNDYGKYLMKVYEKSQDKGRVLVKK